MVYSYTSLSFRHYCYQKCSIFVKTVKYLPGVHLRSNTKLNFYSLNKHNYTSYTEIIADLASYKLFFKKSINFDEFVSSEFLFGQYVTGKGRTFKKKLNF